MTHLMAYSFEKNTILRSNEMLTVPFYSTLCIINEELVTLNWHTVEILSIFNIAFP